MPKHVYVAYTGDIYGLCLFEYAEACTRGVYWRYLGFRFFDCLGGRALLMFRLRFLALWFMCVPEV
jgi:hypothetical protein